MLNDWRHFDDVTSDGKLFLVLATVTGNARSLIVASRVTGTTSAEVLLYHLGRVDLLGSRSIFMVMDCAVDATDRCQRCVRWWV